MADSDDFDLQGCCKDAVNNAVIANTQTIGLCGSDEFSDANRIWMFGQLLNGLYNVSDYTLWQLP
jgi:hypothetical protein